LGGGGGGVERNLISVPTQRKRLKQRKNNEKDKEKVNGLHRVACFDLQPALPTPPGDNAAFYYTSKLFTYNLLSVCDLQKERLGDAHGYLWHESEEKRASTETGSCLMQCCDEVAASSNNDNPEITF
jgi:hypothetical protein